MRAYRLLSALALLLCCRIAAADAIWVVTAAETEVPPLSAVEVELLFLHPGTLGQGLSPYDSADASLRERFYRALGDLSPAAVRAHWAKSVFTGRGQPPRRLKPDEVEAALRNTPGLVTYLPADTAPVGTKVLLTLPSAEVP